MYLPSEGLHPAAPPEYNVIFITGTSMLRLALLHYFPDYSGMFHLVAGRIYSVYGGYMEQ